MSRAIAALVPAVRERSGGRCEAMWHPVNRCRNRADEVHHRLPRSRASKQGDHLLDLTGVIHHLADLCQPCHAEAHAHPDRARDALLIEGRRGITVAGSISTAPDGTLVYTGPHRTFAALYPKEPAWTP